jgi:hypothetical protein
MKYDDKRTVSGSLGWPKFIHVGTQGTKDWLDMGGGRHFSSTLVYLALGLLRHRSRLSRSLTALVSFSTYIHLTVEHLQQLRIQDTSHMQKYVSYMCIFPLIPLFFG